MKLVPREHWTDWNHWLIWHGRRRCYARKPDCSRCEVFKLCPSGKIFLRTGKALKPPENARTFVSRWTRSRTTPERSRSPFLFC